jgi:hypothetical protein
VFIVHNGHCYALELKIPGAQLSEAQQRALIALRKAGAIATHVHGLDQAPRWLEAHCLLKGEAQ